MEHKTFPSFQLKVDADQGIVEHIFAVMGNVDLGDDIIHNGAFTKTFAERGLKARVLDNHNTDSVMRAVGKPLALRELTKDELPPELLQQYPEATGGAWARTQFLLETPEGKGVFTRIKEGAVDEWSFGYDVITKDYSESDGKTVRNLRELRLYEYSPVLWGMNPATTTVSAKSNDKEAPTEGKPYGIFMVDDQHCVYKVDGDGNRTGESLGCHATQTEAQQQIAAIEANENSDKSADEYELDFDLLAEKYGNETADKIKELLANEPQESTDSLTSDANEAEPTEDETALALIEIELQELEMEV